MKSNCIILYYIILNYIVYILYYIMLCYIILFKYIYIYWNIGMDNGCGKHGGFCANMVCVQNHRVPESLDTSAYF